MIPRLTLPILDPTKHCWSQTYGSPIPCALSAYDTGPIMTVHLGLKKKTETMHFKASPIFIDIPGMNPSCPKVFLSPRLNTI